MARKNCTRCTSHESFSNVLAFRTKISPLVTIILYKPSTVMNKRARNFTEDSASAMRTTPLGEKELIRARITAGERMITEEE